MESQVTVCGQDISPKIDDHFYSMERKIEY